MRLNHITISGFRGFATKQEFDLSADATVVVGVNGLGKTSLFDAILWSLSGKLPRVGEDNRVVSLYSSTGEANVTLLLKDASGQDIAIRRNSDGNTQTINVRCGDKELKGASAKSFLSDVLWPEAAASSESESILHSTICRGVYLQQDCIREFLDATTDQERFNTISQLIGTGPLTEFQLQLEKQRTSWTRATTQLQKDEVAIEDRVDSLQRQLEKLQKSSGTNESDDSTPPWSEWWEHATQNGLSQRQFPAVDSLEATTAIDEALREIGTLRDACARRKLLATELQELVGREPAAPALPTQALQEVVRTTGQTLESVSAQLETARERAAELRQAQIQTQELDEQRRALAQLALRLLADKCPVCDQSYDIDATRARLAAIIAEAGPQVLVPDANEEVNTLLGQQKNAQVDAEKAKEALRLAEQILAKRQEWIESCARRIKDLNLPETDSSKLTATLAPIIAECEQRDATLLSLRTSGERLALRLGQVIAKSRIASVTAELQAAEKERNVHRAMIEMRETTGKHANLLLDELREASSKVAVDKLMEIEPFLQRVYARIDPHPAFRVVKFATRLSRGRGRLDAELHDREEDRSSDAPSAVLSSSQMNALAVSIFLTFNLALPRLPIEAALLDDPIQSLDDINLLGVIDLLRRIKDRRQLIVSTHDERFGRLIARKLRPVDTQHRTSVIELSSWSRSGPQVKQLEIGPEPVQLRLIKAG